MSYLDKSVRCKFCHKWLVNWGTGYWEHKDEDYDKCPEVIREREIENGTGFGAKS